VCPLEGEGLFSCPVHSQSPSRAQDTAVGKPSCPGFQVSPGPHLAALALFPHPGTQGPLSSPQFINGLESKSCSTSWTSAQQFQPFPQIELEQQVQSRVHPQPLSEALVNRAV
jgi:hypothetical protein